MKTNNKNMLNFSYPVKYDSGWHYEKPSNVLGGWKSWFFRVWCSPNENGNTVWQGIIILGFKRIKIVYLCNEQKARKEFEIGKKRLADFILKECNSI